MSDGKDKLRPMAFQGEADDDDDYGDGWITLRSRMPIAVPPKGGGEHLAPAPTFYGEQGHNNAINESLQCMMTTTNQNTSRLGFQSAFHPALQRFLGAALSKLNCDNYFQYLIRSTFNLDVNVVVGIAWEMNFDILRTFYIAIV